MADAVRSNKNANTNWRTMLWDKEGRCRERKISEQAVDVGNTAQMV